MSMSDTSPKARESRMRAAMPTVDLYCDAIGDLFERTDAHADVAVSVLFTMLVNFMAACRVQNDLAPDSYVCQQFRQATQKLLMLVDCDVAEVEALKEALSDSGVKQ